MPYAATRLTRIGLFLTALLFTGVATPASADDGPRMFAYFEGDGYFYPCSIEGREGNKLKVKYSAGSTALMEEWAVIKGNINVGDRFEANYQNSGRYYRGRIAQRDGDEVRINYDDGDIEHTTISRLRARFPLTTRAVGMPVMARPAGKGYWYSGTIKEVREGECDVVLDDGGTVTCPDKHIFGYTPTWGDVVEGRWSGDGLYYRATIIGRQNRKLMLRFDDGDVEWTTMTKVRVDYGLVAPKTILIDEYPQ